MARPRKDHHEARSAHLPAVRLTEAELAVLSDQAAASGLTLSDLVRQRMLTGKVTPRPGMVDAHVLSELNRCGVNLNQIARQLNSGRGLPTSIDGLLATFNAVLERVGRAYGP